MTPDDFDRERHAMQAVHRAASDALDERPSMRVRAAVLDEARRVSEAQQTRGFVRHWPRSLAAVLLVSVMTGLVARQVLRDEPERVTGGVAATAAIERSVDEAPKAARAEAEAAPAQAAPRAPATPMPPRKSAEPTQDRVRAKAAIDVPTEIAATKPAQLPAPAAAPAPSTQAPPMVAGEATSDAAPVARSAPLDRAYATSAFARSEPETAAAWLARIVALRRAGRDDAADREVEALRARYPEIVVPDGVATRATAPR